MEARKGRQAVAGASIPPGPGAGGPGPERHTILRAPGGYYPPLRGSPRQPRRSKQLDHSWGRATEGACTSLASTAGREYISPRNASIVTAEGHWPDGIKEDRSCPTTSSIARSARRKSP